MLATFKSELLGPILNNKKKVEDDWEEAIFYNSIDFFRCGKKDFLYFSFIYRNERDERFNEIDTLLQSSDITIIDEDGESYWQSLKELDEAVTILVSYHETYYNKDPNAIMSSIENIENEMRLIINDLIKTDKKG